MRPFFLALVSLVGLLSQRAEAQPELLTVAETSDFQATSRYEQVVEFMDRLAESSTLVTRAELGKSVEGRSIPLMILADPPVSTPAQAARSRKPVVLAFGNIHAGEVCGKEALLMLGRDIVAGRGAPLLDDLIVVFAPIYNCDGNEPMSKDNRRGQKGPADGMGQRQNAEGLDLNRDYVKLEAPETRAMVRFYNQWDPAVIIDTHTTNGSHHRYALTYAAPRNPAGDSGIIEYVRDRMLPAISIDLEAQTGDLSFFYGNFNRDHTQWTTYPAQPRYGTPYRGLRNRIAILSEAYAYASYRDRVLATYDFVRLCLEYTAKNKDEIQRVLKGARDATIAAGRNPKSDDLVAIRNEAVAFDRPVRIPGFVEETVDRRRVSTGRPWNYVVEHVGAFRPTHSVSRPYAYLFPASLSAVVETLQRHGLQVDELREDIELDLEVYRVDEIQRAERAFQKHRLARVDATARPQTRMVAAGTIVVRTAQALGTLACYLLEPGSDDGLCTWNHFDEALEVGADFPVMRLPRRVPIHTGGVRPLAEDRNFDKRLTFDVLYGRRGRRPNFSGSPASGQTWLEDGEHYLQSKGGRRRVIEAATGRSKVFHDPGKMVDALAGLPTINRRAARRLTQRGIRYNPDRTAALFTHENDIYSCGVDGSSAVRLTHSPQREQFTQWSPDGRFVSFVREHDLFVVDVETQTERALTSDGSDKILNGQADWVVAEEIYGHRTPLSWWSPGSQQIAFIQLDDEPVHDFTVVDHIPVRLTLERTPYPKAGDPNPTFRLGVVSAAGGPVRWADLEGYTQGSFLITHVGWLPTGDSVYFYVQDRAQTWLDFNTVTPTGGKPRRLFREDSEAWVSNPRSPSFLKDGSFLLRSERTGWQHVYHFDKHGKVIQAVTEGEWEARTIHLVDEAGGCVYLSGTRDGSTASNLYRVRLDGTGFERLTQGPGSHRVNVSPRGNYFIDSRSDHRTPTQVRLFRTDGTLVRVLDTNPVYVLEEYTLGEYSQFEIETEDGLRLPASLTLPTDFDPNGHYPVWFMTYGGPHFPSIRDSWGGGRTWDRMLAEMGIIAFRCDPHTASGKGAKSAWRAYRRLGIPEVEDIEKAIDWLCQKPYVDASRIGMGGHSYGGFMTAFAMTHSKKFAAGIAGAPVTDWRLYDTIYTERYMDTPQENPEGYDATSVVKSAKNLHGRLLILHGTMDNNVHMQNTMQFIRELQKANKQFELMVYPKSRHGIGSPHYRRLMVDFIQRTIGQAKSPTTPRPDRPAVARGTE